MKLIAILSLFILNCGYSALDAELTGQVKKVVHANPIVCPGYTAVDVSLGFTKNGVGSMSTQDKWLVVPTKVLEKQLHDAMVENKIVKITFNVERVVFCTDTDAFVESVEELK